MFDSREVALGDIFFAIQGARVNGEAFLEEVARRGAKSAVVSTGYMGPDFGLELIRVDDVRSELQRLARVRRESWKVPVIGITGSVGKTTCKEFLVGLLSEKFVVGSPKGSCNSQVSLPTTILNFSGEEEVVVLELGMSFPGEMCRLVNVAQPDFALLTNVSLSHAGNFESAEDIAREKMEIFGSERLKKGFVSEQCPPCDFETFGFGQDCNHRMEIGDGRVRIDGGPWIPFHLMERHFLLNFLGAALVARQLGLSWDEIAQGAAKLKPAKHRFARFERRGVTYIDDSYNASSVSTISALDHLPKGRRLFVFGQMGELGKYTQQAHAEVGAKAAEVIDTALLLGKNCEPIAQQMRAVGKDVWLFENKNEMRAKLNEVVQEGDVVLVKGANSLKMWELIE